MNRDAQPPPPTTDDRRARDGLLFGFGAYFAWGVLPVYFKWLQGVGAFDIVAHRVAWSVPFLVSLLFIAGKWGEVRSILADRRTMTMLAVSAVLIATNWILYVYSVVGGFILAASLGYYLNPLANVLMGRFLLGEKLSRLQWTAVGIAAAGIAVMAFGATTHLWISLTLCVTFATYGLIRKTVKAEAVPGLFFETLWLAPIGVVWLIWRGIDGIPVFGTNATETGLLLAAGVVSTIPLLFFTAGARRLKYSTMGMLQFIAPTLQFLLAVLFYGEHFGVTQAITFGAIWIALGLYVAAMLRERRGERRRLEEVEPTV